MRIDRVVLVGLLAGVVLAGCEPVPPRLKGIESFQSATTPNPPGTWKGDKYASGGIAGATGGLNTKNSYTDGAKTTQKAKEVVPQIDTAGEHKGDVHAEPAHGAADAHGAATPVKPDAHATEAAHGESAGH